MVPISLACRKSGRHAPARHRLSCVNDKAHLAVDNIDKLVLVGVPLAEEASVKAVDGHLAEGSTSVGMRVQLDHLAPTAVGGRVVAEAKLDKVEGRRLCFSVSINDERGLVAAGKVTRVVVERERFLDRSH